MLEIFLDSAHKNSERWMVISLEMEDKWATEIWGQANFLRQVFYMFPLSRSIL